MKRLHDSKLYLSVLLLMIKMSPQSACEKVDSCCKISISSCDINLLLHLITLFAFGDIASSFSKLRFGFCDIESQFEQFCAFFSLPVW